MSSKHCINSQGTGLFTAPVNRPHFPTAIMRKSELTPHFLHSYRSLEECIPGAHPVRKLRVLADTILADMHHDFQALY